MFEGEKWGKRAAIKSRRTKKDSWETDVNNWQETKIKVSEQVRLFSVSPLPAIPLFKNTQKWLLWPKAGGSVENGYVLSWESCAAIPALLRWKGKLLRRVLFARKRLQRTVVSSERRTVPSCLTDKKTCLWHDSFSVVVTEFQRDLRDKVT